jgi:hypothetical protein
MKNKCVLMKCIALPRSVAAYGGFLSTVKVGALYAMPEHLYYSWRGGWADDLFAVPSQLEKLLYIGRKIKLQTFPGDDEVERSVRYK